MHVELGIASFNLFHHHSQKLSVDYGRWTHIPLVWFCCDKN